jgi:hypothetical protein
MVQTALQRQWSISASKGSGSDSGADDLTGPRLPPCAAGNGNGDGGAPTPTSVASSASASSAENAGADTDGRGGR